MTRPILPYPGSKRSVADRIASVFPPHSKYVEPFMGSASVFLAKAPAPKSVLADRNKAVVSLHQALKRSGCRILTGCRAGRAPTFELSKKAISRTKSGNASPCEIYVAARTSTMAKMNDASRTVIGRMQGRPVSPPGSCPQTVSKLKRAAILHGDWLAVSRKHDGRATLTYLDPPYRGPGNKKLGLYRKDSVSPEQVCGFAKSSRGKVVISYSDTPEIRRACKGLSFSRLAMKYASRTINTGKVEKVRELLIANFPLPRKV